MLPPAPDVDAPEEIAIAPLLPEDARPVLNANEPLVPPVPAPSVFNVNDPLDVDPDSPEAIETLPPVEEL